MTWSSSMTGSVSRPAAEVNGVVTAPSHRRTGRPSSPAADETGDQLLDARPDFVADHADHLDRLAGRVGELPVLVAFAGEDRAGVAAAHGDDDVAVPGYGVVELPGLLGGDVD